MALNVYTGVMGTGKTYELVSSVILSAMLAGRRVVTNLEGVNEELILLYLKKQHPEHVGEFGSILHVSDEQIQQPNFLPSLKCPERQAIVSGGDMLVIDEAWRFWPTGKSISDEHMDFFRMHRHHTHPVKGHSCDIALAFQSITDVHRSVRSVIEINFRTTKLKQLGMPTRYRLDFWNGGKQNAGSLIGQRIVKYQKEIFPLYASYAGVGGKELVVDKRQNIFSRGSLWVMVIGCVIVLVVAIYTTLWFFDPASHGVEVSQNTPSSSASSPKASSLSVAAERKKPTALSSNWRVSGLLNLPHANVVVLVDKDRRFSYQPASTFTGSGVFMTGLEDGSLVNSAPFPKIKN